MRWSIGDDIVTIIIKKSVIVSGHRLDVLKYMFECKGVLLLDASTRTYFLNFLN